MGRGGRRGGAVVVVLQGELQVLQSDVRRVETESSRREEIGERSHHSDWAVCTHNQTQPLFLLRVKLSPSHTVTTQYRVYCVRVVCSSWHLNETSTEIHFKKPGISD